MPDFGNGLIVFCVTGVPRQTVHGRAGESHGQALVGAFAFCLGTVQVCRFADSITQRPLCWHSLLTLFCHARPFILDIYLDAYNYRPTEMDAIHFIAQHYFNQNQPQLAYLFAMRGAQIKKPSNLGDIQNVLLRTPAYLYEYEMDRLLGFAAAAIGEWDVCIKSFSKVMRARPEDSIAKDRLKYCEKSKPAGGVVADEDSAFEDTHAEPVNEPHPRSDIDLQREPVEDAYDPNQASSGALSSFFWLFVFFCAAAAVGSYVVRRIFPGFTRKSDKSVV